MRRALRIGTCAAVACVAAGFPATAFGAFPGANGRILFAGSSGTTLRTVNPDGSGIQTIGALGPGFAFTADTRASWSPDGRRIVLAFAGLTVMNADGGGARTLVGGDVRSPTWSPDGQQIAYDVVTGPSTNRRATVYVVGSDGSDPHPLFSTSPCAGKAAGCQPRPVWSASGRIALVSDRGGRRDLWAMNADGTSPVQLTFTAGGDFKDWDWSPDGTRLAFTRVLRSADPMVAASVELFVVNSDGSGLAHLATLGGTYGQQGVAWSPDGTRLASARAVLAGSDVHIDLFTIDPAGGGFRLVTSDGDSWHPSWRPVVEKVPPPGSPAPPRVKLSSRSVRASRGLAGIRTTCLVAGLGDVCAGTLKLATTRRVACGHARRRNVALGAKAFRIPRGRTSIVKVRLPRAGRKLLACKRTLRVRATATVARPTGGALSFRASFRLRAARP